MSQVTLRPWPLVVPASSQKLIETLILREGELNRREQQLEELERQARETGHQQGYREGYQQGREELFSQHLEGVATHAQSAQRLQDQLLSELPQLAAELAIRILGTALHQTPEAVLTMAQNLLTGRQLSPDAVLGLSPHDHSWVTQHQEVLTTTFGTSLTCISDDTLSQGECYIATPHTKIEGTFQAFRSQIEAFLRD